MGAKNRHRLRSYPARVDAVCLLKSAKSLSDLSKTLAGAKGVLCSSLVYAGGYCLGLGLETREIGSLLPAICEHSDSVCLGKYYPEIFREHGCTLISERAVESLSLEGGDSGGHIV